ncbi:VpaChn25_0724 family phage protein [Martelella mediterranea]|uniref:ArsR family transcriptional regulator n=1 Tax=Martelella mediterranea TaxID=293089 RepID=A0A4R3NW60_9HYPH|nr:hypothetical protein [Martelella mediterranea]TCT41164.1 hypothetical protein EDC90_1007141 [Martelella mediterranea]
MNLGVDWEQVRRERARLVILRALAEQLNGSLDSSILEEVLPLSAIREDQPWIREQLKYLEKMDAIKLTVSESIMIATLTKRGRRHIDRDIAIEGVTRPPMLGE